MFPQLESLEIYSDNYSLRQESESHSFQSVQSNAEITIGSIEKFESEVIPTIEAVKMWTEGRNFDLRPRLVDSATGEARLLDSGAQISATKRRPGDKLDTSVNLVAVNGSKINSYGVRELEVKINRKMYRISAMICDVNQDILGADFVNKYRLGLEWDDFDQSELFIVDKRSNIKAPVKIVTVPSDIIRTHHVEEVSSNPSSSTPGDPKPSDSEPISQKTWQSRLFEVACMKKLGSESESVMVGRSSIRAAYRELLLFAGGLHVVVDVVWEVSSIKQKPNP